MQRFFLLFVTLRSGFYSSSDSLFQERQELEKLALKYLELSATGGHHPAMNNLGVLHLGERCMRSTLMISTFFFLPTF